MYTCGLFVVVLFYPGMFKPLLRYTSIALISVIDQKILYVLFVVKSVCFSFEQNIVHRVHDQTTTTPDNSDATMMVFANEFGGSFP